jgi:hypothetical protein
VTSSVDSGLLCEREREILINVGNALQFMQGACGRKSGSCVFTLQIVVVFGGQPVISYVVEIDEKLVCFQYEHMWLVSVTLPG